MAKKKPSSPGKPSTKAASRTRSTTSSTTGKAAKKPSSPPRTDHSRSDGKAASTSLLSAGDAAIRIGPAEQEGYLLLLSRGASPAAACHQLGLSLSLVAETLDADENFQRRVFGVNELLSQNVAAALYRSAMEGSVSAQTFYLKNRPPPEWPTPGAVPPPQPLDDLTDDELIAQFRQDAPALLALLAAEDSKTSGTPQP